MGIASTDLTNFAGAAEGGASGDLVFGNGTTVTIQLAGIDFATTSGGEYGMATADV